MNKKPLFRPLQYLPYILLVGFFIYILMCYRLIVTAGPSMEPTYSPGDKLLCVRSFSSPDPGDVILFKKDGVLLVKRVIATSGQTADIQDDNEPPYSYWGSDTVPDGYVFVAGDNSAESLDSREETFGLVPIESIWGTVFLKF